MNDASLDDLRRYAQACEAYRLATPSLELAECLTLLGNAIGNERLSRDCYDMAYLTREMVGMKSLHSGEVKTTTLEQSHNASGRKVDE